MNYDWPFYAVCGGRLRTSRFRVQSLGKQTFGRANCSESNRQILGILKAVTG